MDLRIERQANQASVISEGCAVAWGVRKHALIPLPLSMAQNEAGVSTGQHRVGIPKVWHCLEKTLPKAYPFAARVTHLPVNYITRNCGVFPLSLVFTVPTDIWYFVSKSLSSRGKKKLQCGRVTPSSWLAWTTQ